MPIVWNAETEAKVRSMLTIANNRRDTSIHIIKAPNADQHACLASRRPLQSLRDQGRRPAAQGAR